MTEKYTEFRESIRKLSELLPKKWKNPELTPEKVNEFIRQTTREFPAEFIESLNEKMLSLILEGDPEFEGLTLVIDSQIIVSDCFRVAKGISSSTLRILSSPFLKAVAPEHITQEVFNQIRTDLPEGAKLDVALAHAKELLGKVRIVKNLAESALSKASKILDQKFGNDVYFLTVAFQLNAKALVSRDIKAFGNIAEMKRWDMRDTSQTVISVESGYLLISLFGEGAISFAEQLFKLLLLLFRALISALKYVGVFLKAGLDRLGSVLKKAPKWVWVVIIVAVAGITIGTALSEEMRDFISKNGEKLLSLTKDVASGTGELMMNATESIIGVMEMFTESSLPYTLPVGAGIALTLSEFFDALDID